MKCLLLALMLAVLLVTGCSKAPLEQGAALTLNNNTDYFNGEGNNNTNITDIPLVEGKGMKILGLNIELLNHASVKIKNRKTIYIDPFQISGSPDLEKADIILITHEHYDHCSPKDVEKIAKPETIIITVPGCQSKLNSLKVKGIVVIEPGKTIAVGGEKITAVPAYNINKPFHAKDNHWVGFIVEMDGVKVYHAGDTDLIPEMKDIDVDIAFLPVGGTYTMTALEAAEATKTFKRCKIAIPMHYGSVIGNASDAETFKENAGCEVKILA